MIEQSEGKVMNTVLNRVQHADYAVRREDVWGWGTDGLHVTNKKR